MEKIVFESDQDNLAYRSLTKKKSKGLPGLVIRLSGGLIKSEVGASLILLLLAIFCFGLSFFILLNTFN